jgi:hypothetical protein
MPRARLGTLQLQRPKKRASIPWLTQRLLKVLNAIRERTDLNDDTQQELVNVIVEAAGALHDRQQTINKMRRLQARLKKR